MNKNHYVDSTSFGLVENERKNYSNNLVYNYNNINIFKDNSMSENPKTIIHNNKRSIEMENEENIINNIQNNSKYGLEQEQHFSSGGFDYFYFNIYSLPLNVSNPKKFKRVRIPMNKLYSLKYGERKHEKIFIIKKIKENKCILLKRIVLKMLICLKSKK